MKKLAEGDQKALSFLVDRYENKLRHFIHSLGKISADDIEDILQETFIRVYQNAKGFDASYSFSSWVYRIARNQTYSFMRKMKVRPHVVLEISDVPSKLLIDEVDLHQDVITKEKKAKLQNSINSLPTKYAEVLQLLVYEEMSQKETSDILKIPVSTVATRYARAKQQLKIVLKNEKD